MTFPPHVPAEVEARMQEMHDRAHARHAMNHGVATVLAYAARTANHRAELWKADNRAPYTLEPFIEYVRTMAQVDAENHLYGILPAAPDKPVHVTIVVPDWVNTCRGNGNPELEAPTWVRVWENTDPADAPRHFPKTENAIALAAYGRRPSLVRADWNWVGIYPFGTMAYDPPPLAEFTARPVAGECDDEEQAAA